MDSKLLLLVITEDTSMQLPAFETALAQRFRTRVVVPANLKISLESVSPDAILLADLSGQKDPALCASLRSMLSNPAVAVVAYAPDAGKDTRVAWLEAGADDVFGGEVDPDEVSARLAARVERLRGLVGGRGGEHSIRAGRLCLDLDRMEARVANEKVSLGPVEFKILCVLAKGLDKLRSRDEIETFVWGDNKPASRALDPHINALRKKIIGSQLELRTVYGAGYSLRSTSPAEGRESGT